MGAKQFQIGKRRFLDKAKAAGNTCRISKGFNAV
jgi:hypothetical protein